MNKVDFILTFTVENANANGDPLAGNMPRTDALGLGEVSDVCIKRKIRNRMHDMGHDIFVKAKEKSDDGFSSLEGRYKGTLGKEKLDDEELENKFNEKWLDVRTFGQVITYKVPGEKRSLSIGIRGPVSISISKSIDPVDIISMQITRSCNGMEAEVGKSKSSDTMGSKHYVEFGTYVVYGAVNSYFAEKTGFDEKDLEVLKECLRTLFVNDASSARPDGSMEVREIFWFEHSSKIGNVSSAKIKDLLKWDTLKERIKKDDKQRFKYEDYNIRLDEEKLKEYENEGSKLTRIQGI